MPSPVRIVVAFTTLQKEIVRALTPVAVTFGAGGILHQWVANPGYAAGAAALVGAAYTMATRTLETRYPRIGRFLVFLKQYSTPPTA